MTYTHGLEKIYAFETINPHTVRTVLAPKVAEVPKGAQNPNTSQIQALQLPLPLGPYYEEGLPSFRLKEPIQMLDLSSFSLKALQSKGVRTVEEAVRFIQHASDETGLGQTHIEEVGEKVHRYVGPEPLALQKSISWKSIVRTVTHDLDTKLRFCLLARHELEKEAHLTATELQEIERMSSLLIDECYEKACSHTRQKHTAFLEGSLKAIFDAYVRPWLRHREGFASKREVLQRLQEISTEPEQFLSHFRFLTSLVESPLQAPLLTCSPEIDELLNKFLVIAKSYFYESTLLYPLSKLTQLIWQDLLAHGTNVRSAFVERALKCHPAFRLAFDHTATVVVGYS